MIKSIFILIAMTFYSSAWAYHAENAIHCQLVAGEGTRSGRDLAVGIDGLSVNRVHLNNPLPMTTLVFLALPYRDNHLVALGAHDRVVVLVLDDENGYARPMDRCLALPEENQKTLRRNAEVLPPELHDLLPTLTAIGELSTHLPTWESMFELCSDSSSLVVTVRISCELKEGSRRHKTSPHKFPQTETVQSFKTQIN